MEQVDDKVLGHCSSDRPQGDCLRMGYLEPLGLEERGKEGEQNTRARTLLSGNVRLLAQSVVVQVALDWGPGPQGCKYCSVANCLGNLGQMPSLWTPGFLPVR